jgi:Rad3-related DNA helicase
MPAGSGKSLYYMALALLLDEPVCVLTATKGLQDQLLGDFAGMGLVDVRGRANYQCEQYPRANCEQAGDYCPLQADCTYRLAHQEALGSKLVVTNYAYWMAVHRYGEGLGPRGLLVCDEAHRVEDELERALSVVLTKDEVDRGSPTGDNLREWVDWAGIVKATAARQAKALADQTAHYHNEAPPEHLLADRRRAERFSNKANAVAAMDGGWVVEKSSNKWSFMLIEPGKRAAELLFAGSPRTLLTSATLTEADIKVLDVSDYQFLDYPCEFDKRLCPVYAVPGVRLRHDSSPEELKRWVEVVDAIVESRGVGANGDRPRKGLIDTVSYERQQYLVRHSRFRELMLTNSSRGGVDGSEKAPAVVQRFREADAPCVLVSPSFSEGWDFAGMDCEWIIAAKVPFPDTRSKVMKARVARDRLLLPRLALRKASQLARRGMRSGRDYCEVFFVDENIRWVYWRHKEFAPGWFEVQGKKVLPAKVRGWRERFGQ